MAIEYGRRNPITVETKCCICNFPLDVTPKGLKSEGNEMSYLDFLIKKEHAFIRNIFDENDLRKSKNIVTEKNISQGHDLIYTFSKGCRK